MDVLQWVNAAVVAIGVPALVVALVHIGRKLQVLDDLKGTSDTIKHNLKAVTDHLTRHDERFDSGTVKW